MRALDHRIPLRPAFRDVPLGIHDHDIVFPARVDAHAPFPILLRVLGKLSRRAAPRKRGCRALRGIAEGHLGGGKREAGAKLRNGRLRRPLDYRQFTPLDNDHAVGALREHAFHRAPAPVFMARQLRHGLGPIAHDFVRPRQIPSPFVAWDRSKSRARLALAAYGLKPRPQQDARYDDHESGRESCQFSMHACLQCNSSYRPSIAAAVSPAILQ
jgi:hypothetical protein